MILFAQLGFAMLRFVLLIGLIFVGYDRIALDGTYVSTVAKNRAFDAAAFCIGIKSDASGHWFRVIYQLSLMLLISVVAGLDQA